MILVTIAAAHSPQPTEQRGAPMTARPVTKTKAKLKTFSASAPVAVAEIPAPLSRLEPLPEPSLSPFPELAKLELPPPLPVVPEPPKDPGGGIGGGEIKCDSDSIIYYQYLSRKPRGNLMNLPEILQGRQSLVFCNVSHYFPDYTAAIFLSRLGLRAAKLAQGIKSPGTICETTHEEMKHALEDIKVMRDLDHSAELEVIENDLREVAAMSCTDLGALVSNDVEQNKYKADLCAWKKLVEAARPGSTAGFSSFFTGTCR